MSLILLVFAFWHRSDCICWHMSMASWLLVIHIAYRGNASCIYLEYYKYKLVSPECGESRLVFLGPEILVPVLEDSITQSVPSHLKNILPQIHILKSMYPSNQQECAFPDLRSMSNGILQALHFSIQLIHTAFTYLKNHLTSLIPEFPRHHISKAEWVRCADSTQFHRWIFIQLAVFVIVLIGFWRIIKTTEKLKLLRKIGSLPEDQLVEWVRREGWGFRAVGLLDEQGGDVDSGCEMED